MAGRMTMKMEGSAVPLLLLLVICHSVTAIGTVRRCMWWGEGTNPKRKEKDGRKGRRSGKEQKQERRKMWKVGK